MIILTIIIQSALCQTQHNTWKESHYSASLPAPSLSLLADGGPTITGRSWIQFFQYLCIQFVPLPTKDLHKVSAVLCLLFQASYASTWIQVLRTTKVLNTRTILELQPIMLWILPGTFGQSLSAFAKHWNLSSATLGSDWLNS